MKRVFVGGTGRSGTTIVYRSIGCHEQVHIFPREMRFLVDPDGLMDLVDALTVRYSPTSAREALYKFERLMRVYLAIPQRAPYLGFELACWIGEEYYFQRLDKFCSELTETEFIGRNWQLEEDSEGKLVDLARHLQALRQRLFGKPVIPLKLQYPREKLKVVRYFHDRKALMGLVADFVDDIFLEATRQAGKTTWSEKTPQNIFHLGFLSELFPDSVFIHIKRDPRGVVYSMTKDSWDRAPEDVGDVCLLLKNMYQAWFDVKRKLDFSKLHYFEFKIEDIAASPEDMLEKIAYVCNLKGRYSNLPDISLSRVNAWQEDMSSPDVNTVEQELGDYIKGMGYDYK